MPDRDAQPPLDPVDVRRPREAGDAVQVVVGVRAVPLLVPGPETELGETELGFGPALRGARGPHPRDRLPAAGLARRGGVDHGHPADAGASEAEADRDPGLTAADHDDPS